MSRSHNRNRFAIPGINPNQTNSEHAAVVQAHLARRGKGKGKKVIALTDDVIEAIE